MTNVAKRFKKLMLASLGVAILDIMIGILFVAYTSFSIDMNVVILGALFLVHGLFYLIRYIYDGLGKKVFAVDLIAAVATLILGGFTLLSNFDASDIIGVVFCVWLVIAGAQKLYFGIKLLKKQDVIYPLITFMSVLFFVMGIVVLINPFKSFMLVTRLIGIFMACTGVFEVMTCTLFKRRTNSILDMFKS